MREELGVAEILEQRFQKCSRIFRINEKRHAHINFTSLGPLFQSFICFFGSLQTAHSNKINHPYASNSQHGNEISFERIRSREIEQEVHVQDLELGGEGVKSRDMHKLRLR